MSTWRRSGKRAPSRRRTDNRLLSMGLQPLEPRAMMAADTDTLFAYDTTAALVSPAWFAQLQPGTPSSSTAGALSALDTVSTIQWKGNSVDVYADQWVLRLNNQGTSAFGSVSEVAGLFADAYFQVEVIGGLGLTGQVLVRTPGATCSVVSDWLGKNSSIAYYEPNLLLPLSQMPNDPSLSNDWGLNNTGQTVGGASGVADADIDAPEAWNLSTGSSSVVVGVIDTGVDVTHPDLAGNIWINPGEIAGNGRDDDGNGFVDDVNGYNFVNNSGSVVDDHGHGTHVSGTIAAKGNNGTGTAGVNWNSSIMALKFLDANGSGSLSNAVRAINYATMMRQNYGVNVRVTNNSWGGGGYEQSLRDAINASGQAGILFVAAAGNAGTNNDASPNYPSNYNLPNVIAVAATDNRDNLASFSNYGATTVDLAAPGVNIYSTKPGGGYQYMSGTSMATPHVTGVAALAWAVDPNASVSQVRDALLGGVDHLASLSGKVASGGRLNAFGTLNKLGLTVVASTPAAGAAISMPPTAFTVDFSQNIDPATLQAADFSVNGRAATSYTLVDGNTVTFRFNTTPVTSDGPQTMQIAEGAIGRLGGGIALRGWQATFYYDQMVTSVVAATPAEGQTFASAPTSITLQFNEAIAAASVGIADLTLSDGTVTQAQWLNATTARYTISLPSVNGSFTYTLAAGGVTDLAGNPGAVYTGHFTVNDPTLVRYQSTGAPLAIPDLGMVVSSITISDSRVIRDVDVEVNITHTWDADLSIYLVAPNGTRIKLAADIGGGGKNFTGTTFDDSATTSITAGAAPFTGRFRPQGSLAALNGLSTAGVWKLEVTDGYQWDTGAINSWSLQFRVNATPVISAIPDQTVAHSASAINVPISVSDPEGSPVSVTVEALDIGQGLRQTLGLWAEPTRVANNYYYGYLAPQMKWLRGGAGDNDYYGIRPNGEMVHLVNFDLAQSPVVAKLDTSYYDNPSKLCTVQSSASLPVQVVVNSQQNLLTISPASNYAGSFYVKVVATDGTDSSSRYFLVNVTNQASVIAPVADQTMSHQADTLVVPLSISKPDGDPLSLSVSAVGLVSNPAYAARQQFSLWAEPTRLTANYYMGYLAPQMKWLRGSAGSNDYYGIRPNGEMVHLVNFDLAQSPLVATFDASFWADPTKLTGAQPTQVAVSASIDAAGKVTIDPPAGFLGDIRVTATVTDGIAPASTSFTVHVVHQPIAVAAVADQTMSHQADTLAVPLSISNPDGDPLSLSVSAVGLVSNPAYAARQQFGLWAEPTRLTANYYMGYLAPQMKWLRGSAGSNDYYGIRPNGEMVHLVNFDLAQSPVVATFDASFWADPTKLTGAQPTQVAVSASIDAAGKVTIDPPAGFLGDIRVTATASDGITPVSTSFTVHVVNQTPSLASVADQTVTATTTATVGGVEIQLNATDADNDSLSYSVNAGSRAYEVRQQFGLWAEPTRVANNYYCGYLGGQIKWLRGGGGSDDYYGIKPTGELIHLVNWNPSVSPVVATFDASYWGDPTKLTNAQPIQIQATVDAAGKVTVTPPTDFVGDIRVTATVSDGVSSDTKSFTVHVVAPGAASSQSIVVTNGVTAASATDSILAAPQVPTTDESVVLAAQTLSVFAVRSEMPLLTPSVAVKATIDLPATRTVAVDLPAATTTSPREELAAMEGFQSFAQVRLEAKDNNSGLIGKALADFDASFESLRWGEELELLAALP